MLTRRRMWLLALLLLGTFAGGGFYWLCAPTKMMKRYAKLRVGMTEAEVEAVLGPGTERDPKTIPGICVAVDPADDEKARQTRPPPTARTYPTRIKPMAEGDRVYEWKDAKTWETIYVAFTDGRVVDKYYHDPGYMSLFTIGWLQ